ncbi:membrane protein [Mycolicibacterium litorale]|uniref:Membrane protein n=2 Tax=Mycolicibacterium litorale TaxID=758802 RepID=A0AAD1IM20_9MYCO|nr:putative membrane protein [Mycolicibacterium litorale]BBY17964.1 membrane protein [Mycolicibacterium litorale]
MTAPSPQWLRLSPRMLLVHPVHEVARQIPVLVGSVVLGSATGNPLWAVAALVVTVGVGVARWFTTTYRIDAEEVQLRAGVLQRRVLSVPRNRIRSVSTDARLLHRLLGLTVLRVSTGQEARGDDAFALDAVEAGQVPHLRAELLAGSLTVPADTAPRGRVLARWQPAWLRYSPLSFTGLAMIAAAAGLLYQAGVGALLRDSRLAADGRDAAQRFGVATTVAAVVIAVLIGSVVLSVLRSLVTYGNLVLRRDADVLHLEHGLLRRQEHTFDMRRLRGGTLREPLLVRAFGGARLDAVMTGVGGAGEASLLLPPCPAQTARRVLSDLIDGEEEVNGPLRGHGAAAARRRWARGLALPALAGAVLAAVSVVGTLPIWVWLPWAALTACCALLAADRVRALGHRVGNGWLVARAGSVERRRDCVAGAGIIGWTVRQTFFQRRAGVATLIAATAAGEKAYRVLDVPADLAWSIAAGASPWVGQLPWARD